MQSNNYFIYPFSDSDFGFDLIFAEPIRPIDASQFTLTSIFPSAFL